MVLIAILFVGFDAYATRKAFIPIEEQIKNLVARADTIFVGKVLGKKIIKDGLITEEIVEFTTIENGVEKGKNKELEREVYDVGVWSMEVKKVYRGNLKIGDTQTVCSMIVYPDNRYSLTEMIYIKDGQEVTIFGNKEGKHVYFPAVLEPVEYDQIILYEIKKKPPHVPTNHDYSRNINIFGSDEEKVLRNVCLEENS
ncbi:hypothetical protein [Methyloglobulus sp.]|uniref:hypothetical protein n=1 Tax=Methyloglobulus sp. TaxID=2518622 RepID=UPI0032B790A8